MEIWLDLKRKCDFLWFYFKQKFQFKAALMRPTRFP